MAKHSRELQALLQQRRALDARIKALQSAERREREKLKRFDIGKAIFGPSLKGRTPGETRALTAIEKSKEKLSYWRGKSTAKAAGTFANQQVQKLRQEIKKAQAKARAKGYSYKAAKIASGEWKQPTPKKATSFKGYQRPREEESIKDHEFKQYRTGIPKVNLWKNDSPNPPGGEITWQSFNPDLDVKDLLILYEGSMSPSERFLIDVLRETNPHILNDKLINVMAGGNYDKIDRRRALLALNRTALQDKYIIKMTSDEFRMLANAHRAAQIFYDASGNPRTTMEEFLNKESEFYKSLSDQDKSVVDELIATTEKIDTPDSYTKSEAKTETHANRALTRQALRAIKENKIKNL